jgi:hypothetical protein
VKQGVRAPVIVDDAVSQEPDPAPVCFRLHELEEVRTDSAVPGVGMDVDVDEGVSLGEQSAIADEPVVALDEPGVAGDVELAPLVEKIGRAQLRFAHEVRL